MKWKIILAFLTFARISFAQNLPVNAETGLVFIKDSIELKNKSLQEVKDIMAKWSYTLIDIENLKKVYKLDNKKQTENIYISLPLYSVLNQERGNNKFQTNGTLSYNKVKTTGLNAADPLLANGSIKFGFIYTITAKKIIYEFTNLEYSHDGLHFGKFEDSKPPADNLNRSLIFKMGKKEWGTVRAEYFDNLKILAANLKEYITNLLQEDQATASQTPINYESYMKITTGMSYEDVAKLLGDDGKELSNSSSAVNGKTVIQQIITWNDLDKTKSITVTFTEGKVSAKVQTNL
ncbi:MAG TPA: hypothetical protein PKC72_09190 [Chitinophagaceae bacterium]|nr:hypothetical protein [Chitinophagaceae bacterium]